MGVESRVEDGERRNEYFEDGSGGYKGTTRNLYSPYEYGVPETSTTKKQMDLPRSSTVKFIVKESLRKDGYVVRDKRKGLHKKVTMLIMVDCMRYYKTKE